MLVVLIRGIGEEGILRVEEAVRVHGGLPHRHHHGEQVSLTITSTETANGLMGVAAMEEVQRVLPVTKPYLRASRDLHHEDSIINLGGHPIGGNGLTIIAGPCAVESRAQTLEVAHAVAAAGAHGLRGGAYKPRTSPYSFQGLGRAGLEILAEARAATGLKIVTEAMAVDQLADVAEVADMIQIGARNMQNFPLLTAVGELGLPVLLKRGMSATLEDWLLAAEYILSAGNPNVVLCERGIRTFADHARNTLDLSVIPAVKAESHLPVLVDPSHGTGQRKLVPSMARAAIAAGADGLLIEVHADPAKAKSDGAQAILPSEFEALMRQIEALAPVVGRRVEAPAPLRG